MMQNALVRALHRTMQHRSAQQTDTVISSPVCSSQYPPRIIGPGEALLRSPGSWRPASFAARQLEFGQPGTGRTGRRRLVDRAGAAGGLRTEFHAQVEALPPVEKEVFDLLWYQELQSGRKAARRAPLNVSELPQSTRRWQAARLQLHDAHQRSDSGVNHHVGRSTGGYVAALGRTSRGREEHRARRTMPRGAGVAARTMPAHCGPRTHEAGSGRSQGRQSRKRTWVHVNTHAELMKRLPHGNGRRCPEVLRLSAKQIGSRRDGGRLQSLAKKSQSLCRPQDDVERRARWHLAASALSPRSGSRGSPSPSQHRPEFYEVGEHERPTLFFTRNLLKVTGSTTSSAMAIPPFAWSAAIMEKRGPWRESTAPTGTVSSIAI